MDASTRHGHGLSGDLPSPTTYDQRGESKKLQIRPWIGAADVHWYPVSSTAPDSPCGAVSNFLIVSPTRPSNIASGDHPCGSTPMIDRDLADPPTALPRGTQSPTNGSTSLEPRRPPPLVDHYVSSGSPPSHVPVASPGGYSDQTARLPGAAYVYRSSRWTLTTFPLRQRTGRDARPNVTTSVPGPASISFGVYISECRGVTWR